MKLSTEIKPGLAYFVGGLIAVFLIILGYFLIAFVGGYDSVLPFLLIGYLSFALIVLFVLSKMSSYFGLGFLVAIFAPVFAFILIIIELSIHPPSE